MTTEVVPPGPFGSPVPEQEEAATLRADTLNLFDSTAVAVSSVAPSYSLAATISFLFVASAFAGPAVIWISFIPVLFIAIAYFHLNRKDPNCGASYTWLSKLMHPMVGWFNGWVQLRPASCSVSQRRSWRERIPWRSSTPLVGSVRAPRATSGSSPWSASHGWHLSPSSASTASDGQRTSSGSW